jgi:hypothetical protein
MHVVLNEKQREIVGKARNRFEDFAAFLLRDAGRGLVEQQNFRPG